MVPLTVSSIIASFEFYPRKNRIKIIRLFLLPALGKVGQECVLMLFWVPLLGLSGAFGCRWVPVGALLGTFGDSLGPFGSFSVPADIVWKLLVIYLVALGVFGDPLSCLWGVLGRLWYQFNLVQCLC